MKVLVLDGDSRVTLAAVRALGRRGCRVDCAELASVPSPLAFRSRFVARRIRLRGLVEQSLATAAEGHDVVLATTRRTIDALALHREAVESRGARVPLAPVDRIRAANDKKHVEECARALGISTPETWDPRDLSELSEIASRVSYPVIVKLRRDEGADMPPAARYAIARDRDELSRAYGRLSVIQPRPLLQRWVQGFGLGVGLLLSKEGEVLAQFTHVRQRELPPRGGPSTACASAHHPAAEAAAARLLRALGLFGVAMVEFRVDAATGVPYLLEVNPRLWGSLELPIRCGVDFPWLLCRWAIGETECAHVYPDGVRLRFLALDAAAALHAIRMPDLRARYAVGFLRDLLAADLPDGIFDPDDPSPGFAYVASRLTSVFRL